MPSAADTVDLSHFQGVQRTKGGKRPAPDDLLALRALFLLLDAWDRHAGQAATDPLLRSDPSTADGRNM